jgi:hypothetical protein
VKGQTIDFDSIIGSMDPPVEVIRVTGTRRALGKDEGENTANLAPMAIQLKDMRLINSNTRILQRML